MPVKLAQVGLQPVLLAVALRGLAQVGNHRVDVVFQLGHLAARLDLDRAGQIALGHRRRHLGNGAHLGGEIGGEQVDVAGEILPRAGGAGHVRLAAEAAVDADFARDVRDLIGEGRQCIGHVVDGIRERRHLALGLHRQALGEVAIGHRRHHFDDSANLFGQIGRHEIHVVGEILPCAADSGYLRLAAELAFRADFARHARDLAREAS